MPSKYSTRERLKLIKRVISRGEPVSQVCAEAGISRVLFYRWLKRYRLKPQKVQPCLSGRRNNENLTKRSHTRYLRLSPEEKIRLVRRAILDNEEVVDICRQAQISRTIFYRWLKKYQQADDKEKLKALSPYHPQPLYHWRRSPLEYEQAVLNLVTRHPEYGIRKLLSNLPQIAGEPIVSHHALQNILKRHNLSLYEQRLVYAQSQVSPVDKLVAVLEQLFSHLFFLSPQKRAVVVRFIWVVTLSTFSTIILLGAAGYLATVASSTFLARPGLIFATISLFSGMIFFLYSMKYYFMLTLLLSFSSRSLTVEAEVRKRQKINQKNGFWLSLAKVFGAETSFGKSKTQEVEGRGLIADIDSVKPERYPFISVQLPFYNEKRVASRIISACTAMDYPHMPDGSPGFEVIICDDSTDETVKIVNSWANHPQVKILRRKDRKGFKGGALSFALKAMDPKTEFVCIFDADFVPYSDTLIQFVKYFKVSGAWSEEKSFEAGGVRTMAYRTNSKSEDEKREVGVDPLETQEKSLLAKGKIAAVAGYQWHVLNKSQNWITRGVRTEYAGSYVIERPGQEILGGMKIIHGSVYAIRADVLKHFGWGTSITEDYELTLRLYAQGFRVLYTPYIQAPSECVSTIRRLVRQRMRWAEGHSYNTKKLFWKLLFGRWEKVMSYEDEARLTTHNSSQKTFIPSPLTFPEKIEFCYLAPYYLQALFFLVGSLAWIISEAVFRERLPFWTSLWGWSLVLTNFLALPLVNAVGLFLEESEEKDYLGIFSFVALCYILVPFQAFAAVKGFLEPEEGTWFRTPKTGVITDTLIRGKFYRWLTNLLFLKPQTGGLVKSRMALVPAANPYTLLKTANNRFNNFSLNLKSRCRFIPRLVLILLIIISLTLYSLTRGMPEVLATNPSGTFNLHTNTSGVITASVSHQLQDAGADAACDTGQSVKPGKGTGWRQFRPDVNNNNVDAGTPCPASATGTGWVFDTQFGSDGYISSGAWNFYLYTSDNAANNTGYLKTCVYRAAVSSGAISSSALLFEYTGSTDVWTGGGADRTLTTGATPCSGTDNRCEFTSSQNYLYIDFYVDSNNGANSAQAAMTFGEEQCGTSPYVRIVTPTVQIPENLILLSAVAPLIVGAILWMRKRKERLI